MSVVIDQFMYKQLLDRRGKLERQINKPDHSVGLQSLLEQVDAALARIDDGSYGICEICHEPVECDRLIADPLVRFCLDHLDDQERQALERDLELAAKVQRGLLPQEQMSCNGWHVRYHYEPAGIVSGDYCDVVDAGDAGLYFMVGDVAGKGVAASMLMAHLHAMFRTLISVRMPLKDMLRHASRVFSESTLPTHYATLVCGRAKCDGTAEIANAGHPHPLVISNGSVRALESSDLPVGIFGDEEFSVTELTLAPGSCMLIYSDGVSEATDGSGQEFGEERLRRLLATVSNATASSLVCACRDDLKTFRGGRRSDDVTLFGLGRAHAIM